jgi:hypothetical protein
VDFQVWTCMHILIVMIQNLQQIPQLFALHSTTSSPIYSSSDSQRTVCVESLGCTGYASVGVYLTQYPVILKLNVYSCIIINECFHVYSYPCISIFSL